MTTAAPPGPAWLAHLPPGQTRSFAQGETISLPDAAENRLFVLTSGRARVCLNGGSRDLSLAMLRPGGIYVTHTRAWVEALEPATITSWPMRDLLGVITAEPQFAVAALREIGTVLHGALDVIEDLAFRPVESRLARHLLSEMAAQGGPRLQLDPVGTLAEALGTSRQTLSTLLNRLIRDGVLERDGRAMVVLDPATLDDLAEVSSG